MSEHTLLETGDHGPAVGAILGLDDRSDVDRRRQMRHQPLMEAVDALPARGPALGFQQAELCIGTQDGLRRPHEVAGLQVIAEQVRPGQGDSLASQR